MPPSQPRWINSPRCAPLVSLFEDARAARAQSWEQIEDGFIAAMSAFDASIAATSGTPLSGDERTELKADLQNGKGDFFNDLIALLLQNCAGIELLSTRRAVPGLIVERHNLDGVYPDEGPLRFMLEAKATGTPKHFDSPKQKDRGRPASADLGKRVKELAFKTIDLKGEFSRLRTAEGDAPTGSAGGGDLTTWLRTVDPKIYFFLACRVVDDTDLAATIRWAQAALQVVDAVGLFCFTPVGDGYTSYAKVDRIPTELQINRVLYKACTELRAMA